MRASALTMRSTFVRCAAVALLAAAPCFAHAAPVPRHGETLAAGAAECHHGKDASGKLCDEGAEPASRARDDARAYADANSTRLRNRAYLRAAASYCERYTGRVRAACVDEAAAIYGP